MYSAPIAATIGCAVRGVATRHEPRSRAQRAHRRQVCRARLAARAGNHEHVAVVAFVRVGLPRLKDLAHRPRA